MLRLIVSSVLVAVLLVGCSGEALCAAGAPESASGSWEKIFDSQDMSTQITDLTLLGGTLLIGINHDAIGLLDLQTETLSWVCNLPLAAIDSQFDGETLHLGGSAWDPATPTFWKYDGHTWYCSLPLSSSGFSASVLAVLIDGSGHTWAVIHPSRLEVLRGDEWSVLSENIWMVDFSIEFVPPDEVWLSPGGLEDRRLYVWSTEDLMLKRCVSSSTGGGKATDCCGCIFNDSRGITWVYGGFEAERQPFLSLYYDGLWYDIDMSWSPSITAITEDREGNMWFGLAEGLLKLGANDIAWTYFPPGGPTWEDGYVGREMVAAPNGKLYVAMVSGLWSFEE